MYLLVVSWNHRNSNRQSATMHGTLYSADSNRKIDQKRANRVVLNWFLS